MNIKAVLIPLLTITFAISIYYSISNSPKTDGLSMLIVGITAGYAPYISINEDGQYEGFDIDVANLLAKKLNKKIEFKDLGSMAPLMIALEQGSIDMIIWGLTITQDRLKRLNMIHYQGEKTTTNPLAFWKNIPENIQTLDDMKGLTISVEPTSFQADVLANYKDIIILPTEKVDDALLNIQYGKSDAALLDPEIVKKFRAKYPEIQIVDVPLKENEQALGIGIAIKKENEKLINEISSAITELKQNGSLKQLELKWNIQ